MLRSQEQHRRAYVEQVRRSFLEHREALLRGGLLAPDGQSLPVLHIDQAGFTVRGIDSRGEPVPYTTSYEDFVGRQLHAI